MVILYVRFPCGVPAKAPVELFLVGHILESIAYCNGIGIDSRGGNNHRSGQFCRSGVSHIYHEVFWLGTQCRIGCIRPHSEIIIVAHFQVLKYVGALRGCHCRNLPDIAQVFTVSQKQGEPDRISCIFPSQFHIQRLLELFRSQRMRRGQSLPFRGLAVLVRTADYKHSREEKCNHHLHNHSHRFAP